MKVFNWMCLTVTVSRPVIENGLCSFYGFHIRRAYEESNKSLGGPGKSPGAKTPRLALTFEMSNGCVLRFLSKMGNPTRTADSKYRAGVFGFIRTAHRAGCLDYRLAVQIVESHHGRPE